MSRNFIVSFLAGFLIYQAHALDWKLPRDFTNQAAFQVEWIRMTNGLRIVSRTNPPLDVVTGFWRDSMVTNGFGAGGFYGVPSAIFDDQRNLFQLHPGYNSTRPDELLAVITWTAPESGDYTILGQFAVGNTNRASPNSCCPDGVDYWIFLNDNLTSRLWSAPSPQVSARWTDPFTPDASTPFALTQTLLQGDRLSLAIRPRSTENYDATLLQVSIQPAEGRPPEAAMDLQDWRSNLAPNGGFTLEYPATGIGVRFNWFRDGVFLTNTALPRISVPATAQPTEQYFQVVATNEFGSLTSKVARVVFSPAPYITRKPPARIITTNPVAEIEVDLLPTANSSRVIGTGLPTLYRQGVYVSTHHSTFSEARFLVTSNGTYTVRISKNGETNSTPVEVYFIRPSAEPPWINLASLQSTNQSPLRLVAAVEAGRTYQVETSSNLFQWTQAQTWFATNATQIIGLPATAPATFYRLVIIPTE